MKNLTKKVSVVLLITAILASALPSTMAEPLTKQSAPSNTLGELPVYFWHGLWEVIKYIFGPGEGGNSSG